METPCYLHTYDTLNKQLRGIAEVILGWDHLDTSLALHWAATRGKTGFCKIEHGGSSDGAPDVCHHCGGLAAVAALHDSMVA